MGPRLCEPATTAAVGSRKLRKSFCVPELCTKIVKKVGFRLRELVSEYTIFDIPLSAQFCKGRWEFGRTGRAASKDDGQ